MAVVINIENFVRQSCQGPALAVCGKLVEHLKWLRGRIAIGDMEAINKFFNLYRFDENQTSDAIVPRQNEKLSAALAKDGERWRRFASSPQTALMLGSDKDPNSKDEDWVKECNRLIDLKAEIRSDR